MIVEKTTEHLKLAFALWTRQAVQKLLKSRLGITMPIRTVSEYLKRWRFTPQKPLQHAYEQRPVGVRTWLDEEYPEIANRAKQEGAEIHYCQHGRGYSPKDKTHVIRLSAKRTSLNMLSSITNQGKFRFMMYYDTMNAKMCITFIKSLLKEADQEIFLILNNLRVHHARVVQEWLNDYTEKIELFFRPAYSTELHPPK